MRKRVLMSVLLVLCLALVVPRTTAAGTGIFTFTSPVPSINHATGSQYVLIGYNLYWGTSSENYTQWVLIPRCLDCPLPSVEGVQEYHCLAGFTPGTTYYFVVTALYEGDIESDPSNEAVKTMPAPTRPTGNLTDFLSSRDRVDGYDLIYFNKNFGKRIVGTYCYPANFSKWTRDAERSDLNNDGSVDGYDRNILYSNYGKTYP